MSSVKRAHTKDVKHYLFIITTMKQNPYIVQYIRKMEWLIMNVISKTCTHEGCKRISIYNYENETKALFCSIHKEDGISDRIRD
jgi:nitrite reductase/ring-hydroxylating ferredoxin subunit